MHKYPQLFGIIYIKVIKQQAAATAQVKKKKLFDYGYGLGKALDGARRKAKEDNPDSGTFNDGRMA